VSDEKTRKRRRGDGPGWLATLGGALVLVVLGFGIGLVGGAAYEEPGLVADHLAGRTQQVELAELDPAPRAEASGPAPAPAPRAPLGVPSAIPPRVRPSAEPPAVATAPPTRAPQSARPPSALGTGFSVQVGAFGERGGADALAARLRADGFGAGVVHVSGGAAPYKVRVGPADSREQALKLAARLERDHELPTWVVAPD
jgi:cell division septation protein DedD